MMAQLCQVLLSGETQGRLEAFSVDGNVLRFRRVPYEVHGQIANSKQSIVEGNGLEQR